MRHIGISGRCSKDPDLSRFSQLVCFSPISRGACFLAIYINEDESDGGF